MRNSAAALTVAVISVVCASVLRALEPPVWATSALVAILLAATLGGATVPRRRAGQGRAERGPRP
ncbi:hypothetical protein [Streptomyces sp. enrichment culture]|uniref:hypothetical protein n=1 Tax=Streptomyces sp. enrichment culture TaxID=1795815 RepID=UPI003F56D26D